MDSLGKGKGRASKGKGKGRMSWGSRKTLQQRILESNCRLCGKKGHWRNECPNKGQSASSVSNAAVTLSVAMPTAETESSLPEEFLLLPEMPAPATKDILSSESVFVQSVFYAETSREKKTKPQESSNMSKLREKIRNHIKGTYETNFGVKSLVSRIEQKFRHQALQNTGKPNRMPRILRPEDVTARERPLCQKPSCPTETAQFSKMPGVSPDTAHAVPPTEIMFATHDTWGILDTGATKTVMGSDHIKEFLEGLNPTIKDHVKRCSCEVLFRFGNQGTLKSSQALVLSVGGMWLKIAVVKGATPFLISNTLLRALGALIDTQNHQLKIPKFNANINLKLTSKGLYLIDMNKLTDIAPIPKSLASSAETFAQDTIQSSQNAETVNPDVPAVQMHEAGSGETEQLSNKHTTTTLMEENPIQEIPLSSAEITSKQPVTHRVHAEITTKSTVFSPSIRAPNRSVASPWTHEQLEPTLVKSAGTCGQSPRAGTNQPSWAGRAEDHANGLWKSPCGENVPRDMGHQPLVDQVVSGSLCIESEDRAQAHDSIHSPEDRGVRGRDAPTSRKEPSTCLGRPPEKHSGTQPDHRDTRRDRVRDDVRGPMGQSSRDQRGHQCSPGKNAQPGDSHAAHAHHDAECHAVDKPSADQHPRICCSRMGRSLEQLDEHQACSHWDHQAGEIDNFCSSSPNKESVRFWELVRTMEKELTDLSKIIHSQGPKLDLLEVFCHEDSMLTTQVRNLGGTAQRHGLSQGDLMTTDGRRKLFTLLLRQCPRHVWVSPVCGPWGQWSNFNSSRSLQAWDRVHEARWDMLSQVALCVVLCRHQHRCNRHAHWEQPKGSTMLKLPYVQEIYRYMIVARPDLCNAGALKDPSSELPIRKGLNIVTSSKRLFEAIDLLRCTRDHVHQPIEGSTRLNGVSIARSKFSESYPRKFARLTAKSLLQCRFPGEKPLGHIVDPVLSMIDALSAEANAASACERSNKRPRMSPKQGVKQGAATGAHDNQKAPKRLRSQPSEPSPMAQESTEIKIDEKKLQEITTRIENLLPRVGKKQIDSPSIFQELQDLFPDMLIKRIVACKGTDRRWGPPQSINPEEAPFRRSIMKLRSNLQVTIDPKWEQYNLLSNRQIIRKSPACRVNITMFAVSKPVPMPARSNSDEGASSGSENQSQSQLPEATEETPEMPEGSDQNVDKVEEKEIPQNQNTEIPREPMSPTTAFDGTPLGTDVTSWGEENHGPRFKALPREEQILLRRAHQNLCHPSADQFSAVLRSQGCRPELFHAVYDMKCPTCIANQKPKIARPSVFKDALDFNDKVFIDGITWTSKAGHHFHFYHLLDQATNFHVAIPAPSRAADQAVMRVSEAWFNWAGPPNTLMMDSATEFTSEVFQEFLQRHEVKGVITSPHAHWQNGRCERHGQILQTMLNKLDHEKPIESYHDLHQALIQCTHAKNSLSIRKGYAPEVLVFGKSSKIPGSITSSDDMSAHASADREDAQGIAFRQQLALRERARSAFHQADNDMALRRAFLRRTRPDRQGYAPGEWVMMWQPQSQNMGYWFGPLKVVQQEQNLSVWATKAGRLHRRALEHVRPVSSAEARQAIQEGDEPIPEMTEQSPMVEQGTRENTNQGDDLPISNDNNPPLNNDGNTPNGNHPSSEDNSSQSQDQPDQEPDEGQPDDSQSQNVTPSHIDTPIPENDVDDDLVTTHLLCCDAEELTVNPSETPCAWKFEMEAPSHLRANEVACMTADEVLLASSEKKQRTEVKLAMLNAEEKKAFQEAKQTEIKNWLATGTVSKILRTKLAPEQILRCRWLLVWKEKDNGVPKVQGNSATTSKLSKLETHKPKARLVVLGYLDPNLTEVPRDSPTLGRQSKMLLLQLIASYGWSLGSFDIKAAFLQGKPQQDRIMGLEPVPELTAAMGLQPNEICKLDKSAYGLIDAPFLWFKTLCDELMKLGFQPSPFDPCLYVLREPSNGKLAGVLGVHVDDGIHGGNDYFHQQIQNLRPNTLLVPKSPDHSLSQELT